MSSVTSKDHVFLSPSSATRWMTCTPSAHFEKQFVRPESDYADEGTFAHYLAIDLMLKNHFNQISKSVYDTGLKAAKKHKFYSAELYSYCQDFTNRVIEYYHRCSEPMIFFEIQVGLSEYIVESFGTIDVLIVAEDVLHIIDFKYGKGIYVEAEDNTQLKIYGLGALTVARTLAEVNNFYGSIFQPRLNNYETFQVSVGELEAWGTEQLKPLAIKAFEGSGEFVPGDHCRFCSAKNNCKALHDKNLNIAKLKFLEVNKLNDKDIADVLSKKDLIINWINSVSNYALEQALNNKKIWPGFKLVRGKSNRKYSNITAILAKLKKAKVDENLYMSEPELISITNLEKNLGKSKVDNLIGQYIVKPLGAPTLVPNDDARSAIDPNEEAKLVFNNL